MQEVLSFLFKFDYFDSLIEKITSIAIAAKISCHNDSLPKFLPLTR